MIFDHPMSRSTKRESQQLPMLIGGNIDPLMHQWLAAARYVWWWRLLCIAWIELRGALTSTSVHWPFCQRRSCRKEASSRVVLGGEIDVHSSHKLHLYFVWKNNPYLVHEWRRLSITHHHQFYCVDQSPPRGKLMLSFCGTTMFLKICSLWLSKNDIG